MFSGLLILILILSGVLYCHGQAEYSFLYQKPEDCVNRQFYNIATYQCEDCQIPNSIASPDKLSCVCPSNFKTTYEAIVDSSNVLQRLFTCTECGTNEEVSRDGTECIIPTGCSGSQSVVQRSLDGTPLPTSQCNTCVGNTSDSGISTNSPCTYCPLCSCSTQIKDDICIVPNITPDPYQSSSSWWLRSKGLAAFYGCSASIPNITACQILSNMCVMQMYDTGTQACQDYSSLYAAGLGDSNVVEPRTTDMPWLYYAGTLAAAELGTVRLPSLPTVFSFKNAGETQLKFIAATYNHLGKFIGFKDVLTSNIFQNCPDTTVRKEAAFRFGTTYQSNCEIRASDLWNEDLYPNLFYEIFLIYEEEGQQFIYAVPVIITNAFPENNEEDNEISLRRFALVDSLLGVESEGEEATFVRVVTDISLRITLNDDDGSDASKLGTVELPRLYITTRDVSIEEQENQIPLSFEIKYSQPELSQFLTILIILVCVGVLSFIWAFFQLSAWRRREGLKYIEGKTFLMLIIFLFSNIGNAFFLMIYAIVFVRFVVYKGQDIVSVTAPNEDLDSYVIIFISIAFVFKVIEYIATILKQSSVDIFFVDWEQPNAKKENKVSAWRSYLVANEWQELQTVRKINLGFHLFLVVLFLEVFGFKGLALQSPEAGVGYTNDAAVYPGVYNLSMRFALLTTTYLVIELVQVLFNSIIYEQLIENKTAEFVDLCSVANVSLLILVEKQHGYYIHGRSVHGNAEVDMCQMAMNLNRERDNLTGSRGLEAGSSLQTFHISIPDRFRYQYDKIYYPLQMKRVGQTATQGGQGKGKKFSKNVEVTSAAYSTMRNFLISFFDHHFQDMDYYIKDRLFFENLLDMEFHQPIDNAVLYNDPGAHFSDELFYGQEFLLMTFEILLMCIVDFGSENFILAAFITFVVQQVLVFVRQEMSKNNLVRKTLVDERFLI